MVKRLPWYQNFQIIAYVVGGLAALGTVIVVANKYLTLPERVEAAEKTNQQQDKILDRLTTLQEYYAKNPPNAPANAAQQRPHESKFREYDEKNKQAWCCDEKEYDACWEKDKDGHNQWEVCE